MTIQLPITPADGTPSGDPNAELILLEFSDRIFGGGTPFTLPLSGSASSAGYEYVSTEQMLAQAELRTRPSDSLLPP